MTGCSEMGHPRLTLEQFEALYDALLANADRLCRDAEVLLAAGSVGRANSLAILALEELAKAIDLHEIRADAARRSLTEPELDARFWSEWTKHIPKLKRVRRFLVNEDYWFGSPPPPHDLLLGPIEDYFADLDRYAREGNATKMAGFYVDVDHRGKLLEPRKGEGDDVDVPAVIALVEQIGWQIRQGDHIVFRRYQSEIEALGDRSAFRLCAYSGEQQMACIDSPGWEAYRRSLQALWASLHGEDTE